MHAEELLAHPTMYLAASPCGDTARPRSGTVAVRRNEASGSGAAGSPYGTTAEAS